MRHALTASLAAVGVLVGSVIGGAAVAVALRPESASASETQSSSIIASAQLNDDVHITGSIASPQIILTTPAAAFDGSPVRLDFDDEYANMIPDPSSSLNGLGFEVYIDGVHLTRLGLFGSHSQTSLFGPIDLTAFLDGPLAIPAGTHTVSIGVWPWSAGGDGYLKASTNAPAVPVRVPLTRA